MTLLHPKQGTNCYQAKFIPRMYWLLWITWWIKL